MAKNPMLAKAKAKEDEHEDEDCKIKKEANRRIALCREVKDAVAPYLRECYYFAAPWRHREVTSTHPPPTVARRQNDIQPDQSVGVEMAQDFLTEALNAFCPPTTAWAKLTFAKPVPEEGDDEWTDEVGDAVAALEMHTKTIFAAIRDSNFYPAIAQGLNPELAMGIAAVFIQDRDHNGVPIVVPVTIRELEINIGHDASVDDRAVVKHYRNPMVRRIIGEDAWARLPKDCCRKIEDNKDKTTEVRWQFWKINDLKDEPAWQAVLMVDCEVAWRAELKGEGSCPLVVGRFNPDAEFPFGVGPLMQSIFELRAYDESRALMLEHLETAVHPPWAYPSDADINLEAGGGIRAGHAYPVRPGRSNDFKPLFFEGDIRWGSEEEAAMARRIRRFGFVDKPEQRGDTPPTATQWVDEMAQTQRRIGTPGWAFWREFCAGVFMRFHHMLRQSGDIQKITINGVDVVAKPYNPAERAQDHQEVTTAMQFIGFAAQAFPQISQVAIDPLGTLKNMKKRLGDNIVVIVDPQQLQAAVSQVGSILGGGQPEGADLGAVPGGVPGGPVA